jgi:adenylate cyclase
VDPLDPEVNRPPKKPSNEGLRLPRHLLEYLERAGVTQEAAEEAIREGQLHRLAVDVILGPIDQRMSIEELSSRSGVEIDSLRSIWRALGFIDVEEGSKIYSEVDLEATVVLKPLIRTEMGRDIAIKLARIVGSSMSRIAEAEVVAALVGERSGPIVSALEAYDQNLELADRFARFAERTLSVVPELLGYSWLRHLHGSAQRIISTSDRSLLDSSLIELSVAFIDMVGFTALSQQLSAKELTKVVAHFEALAYDTVAEVGGRVVKTIGDEIMFVSEDPVLATEICLVLRERFAQENDMSAQVRAGVAFGPVLPISGDYFGTVVNLASRIVNIASPGAVVVADLVHERIERSDKFDTFALRSRYIKDIGYEQLWAVVRKGEFSIGEQ